MVFQQHHLIGRSSVLHNVLMGRLGHRSGWASLGPWGRADKALALAAIDRVGLLERALQRADQLSGGQQQRVGVARALVQQPRVLLADEPVASLDPATAERLLALMHDICRRERLCVVVSLHQVAFARAFADRIIGLRKGAVVFDSDAAALTEPMLGALYGSGDVDAGVSGPDPDPATAEPPRRADPATPSPSPPTPAVSASTS
jgi:phosphonate transport system ATP-binding protein